MFKSLRRWFNGSPRVRHIKVRTNQVRARLEILEDRLAPSVFDDNSLADILKPPDGVVTVRMAIEAVNADPCGNTAACEFAGWASDGNCLSRVFDMNPIFAHVSAIVTDDHDVAAEFDPHREPRGRDDKR